MKLTVNRKSSATCKHCSRGIRLANSLRTGLCCCAREIDGVELVLGVCTSCQMVAT